MVTRVLGMGLVALFVGAVAQAQQKAVELELMQTIQAEGGVVYAASFSPDGRWLATGGELGDLRMLEVATGKILWSEKPGDHSYGVIEFSPDGERVAYRGQHLTVHDAASGKEQSRVEGIGRGGFAWFPDGRGIAYARGRDLVVYVGGRAVARASFEDPIETIAVGAAGDLLVGDFVGRVWRVPAGEAGPVLQFDHRQGSRPVRSIRLCFVAGVLFDLAWKGPLRRGSDVFAVPSTPFALAVTPDGRSFAVGGSESFREAPVGKAVVRWWREGGAAYDDVVVTGSVAALAFHPDGTRLFVSTYEGGQALHERGREPAAVPSHPAQVRKVAMTPDGTAVAVQGTQWIVHALDGRPTRALGRVARVGPGRRAAELLIERPGKVVVWDTSSGKELRSLVTRRFPYGASALGPGDLLFVEGALFDEAGTCVGQLPEDVHFFHYSHVAHASDGRWAIGGVWGNHGQVGCLLLTDSHGKEPVVVDERPVYFVTFSPDGKHLYYVRPNGWSSAHPDDGRLCIRDTGTTALLGEIDARIAQWVFLDDARALVRSEGRLQLWDVDGRRPIQTLLTGIGAFQLADDRRTLAIQEHSPRGPATEVRVYRLE